MAYSGKFMPVNKEKYKGDFYKINYRSSWEHWFMKYLDNNPQVVKWNSECVVIPYFSTADGRRRRYFMDFWAKFDMGNGEYKEFFFEVKPKKETIAPKQPAKLTVQAKKRFINELYTWKVNSDKWVAAEKVATKHNITFRLLTENGLRRLGMVL